MTEPQASPEPKNTKNRTRATLLFLMGMAMVLATFVILSLQDPPPNMPRNATHKLRFTHDGTLLGLPGESGLKSDSGSDSPLDPGMQLDKKATEKRVNAICASCHGLPSVDLSTHPCSAGTGPCLPPQHPPKSECIKCHRMPPPSK